MKLGAEPKKVIALCVLLGIAGVVYYMNSSDGPTPASQPVAVSPQAPAATTPAPAAAPVAGITAPATATAERRRTTNGSLVKEFKPALGVKDPKDRPDPATIDPAIRWDLLAKVQSIETGPPGRNLFQFGVAPPPPAAQIKLPSVPQIAINKPPTPVQPSGPPPPAPKPQAPPMTFKYYGYKISKSDGHKAAFLLDGDDILIAGENDTVKKHYRVVRIANTSITIEDTDFKSTQTLPIQENQAG